MGLFGKSNPKRKYADRLGVELTMGYDQTLRSFRWRTHEFRGGSPSWVQTFVFSELQLEKLETVAKMIHNHFLEFYDLRKPDPSGLLSSETPLKEFLRNPTLTFFSSNPTTHEAVSSQRNIATKRHDIMATLSYLKHYGFSIEFGYRTHRADETGAPQEEIHVYRGRVTSFKGENFNIEGHRGVRSFKLSRVEWAHGNSSTPWDKPVYLVKSQFGPSGSSMGGNTLITQWGVQGECNELALLDSSTVPSERL